METEGEGTETTGVSIVTDGGGDVFFTSDIAVEEQPDKSPKRKSS
jgi:hypothetical protein